MPTKMIKTSDITKFWASILHLGVILVVLYATSFYSYVLFHTLSEIVSVILAVAIFLVAWNSRRYWNNNYYIILGFGFFFVGIIDLLHAFEYKGVGIIQEGGNSNIATQLWLAGRYLIAVAFLSASFFKARNIKASAIFGIFASITALLLLSIFYWKIFPVAYADGIGLTVFKKMSEYIIMILFLVAFYFFYRKREKFHGRFFRLLSLVLLTMVLTEISFTLYVGVYDFFNLLGHLLKIVAYYFAYLGIVEFGLMRPYQTLFKDLKDKSIALHHETGEWKLMFNSIADPTFILDNNHTVTEVNDAMCDFMGVSKEKLIGKKCFEIMHKKRNPWETCPMKITCQSKKSHTEEIYEPTLDKTLLVTTSPIMDKDGNVIGILHISKDITEQKEIERAKDEFIALASHQLRTPLASISLASELLLRGVQGDVDPEQKEMLSEINHSTKRMSTLISRMLNVSRIELGTLAVNLEPLEINNCIEGMIGEMESQIKEKNLTLHKVFEKELPVAKLDVNIMRIIMENLMANAIRYTSSGGTITVSLVKQEKEILLSVCDTGCGIPEKDQEKVFQKSFRAGNARHITADGQGLGLYMVQSVIKKIGATIRLESQEGKGTTFFVTLPIDENELT